MNNPLQTITIPFIGAATFGATVNRAATDKQDFDMYVYQILFGATFDCTGGARISSVVVFANNVEANFFSVGSSTNILCRFDYQYIPLDIQPRSYAQSVQFLNPFIVRANEPLSIYFSTLNGAQAVNASGSMIVYYSRVPTRF